MNDPHAQTGTSRAASAAGSMPTVLAFDTSTERLAVALVHRGRRWVVDAAGGAAASAALLPQAHGLLVQAGCGWQDLDAIGFGRGPGAFTGLRTSCAVAQGLAFGLERPVLAIDSLLLVAEQARKREGACDIAVAVDARMGEVYAARYRFQHEAWQVLQPPGLWQPTALAERWASVAAPGGPAFVAGSGATMLPPGLQRIDAGEQRADALLELALAAWRRDETVPAEQALPLYLRDKVALTSAERLAARQADPQPVPQAARAADREISRGSTRAGRVSRSRS